MTTPPRRGRGRPATFTTATRRVFLDAVAAGTPLGQATQLAGVSPTTPRRHARTDPAFAADLAAAKAAGREARLANVPHGESRYNNYGCRCTTCRTAATTARTNRRHTTNPDPQVVTLPAPAASSCPSSLLLAKAS
ncbi:MULTISPECIES: hypothetical protein [Streptomyces]|uniref:Uncharacterized protein n=1 Tax=Streptomyces fradiae ATCC 10745 = DSM 40063 TaxID=1319510 RepID=A0ABQ6XM63_STRFR|nr:MULTISPECIES: hypothetical protein [Streptomyces]KAF0646592.1 hypothetical protein K701_27980 [Streptomyces fradiae ATCC 10745 = DSM 40063]